MYYLRNKSSPDIYQVCTTYLDHEFPIQTIDFLKIDAQGAESHILVGAREMFEQERIKLLYVEWSGERGVIDNIPGKTFDIFDSIYVYQPHNGDPTTIESMGFKITGEIPLSTGVSAFELVLGESNHSPESAINEINKRKLGFIHTDLIVVNRKIKSQFIQTLESDRVNQE